MVFSVGKWEGEPYQPGGVVAPQVQLIEDLVITGDLNGDGSDEAVVLLNYAPGGTGQFLYLAVMIEQQGLLANVATEFVGDRVRIRDLRIENSQIVLDVVRCDGQLGEDAFLVARWSELSGKDKKLLAASRSSIREPVTGSGHAAVVAAQSRALAKLSSEIVAAINEASRGQ